MAKKHWSTLVEPLEDWMLVRIPEEGGQVLLAEKDGAGRVQVSKGAGAARKNHGIVVSIGPGALNSEGQTVPIPKNITVGCTVLFRGEAKQRPDDYKAEMEAEDLWFVPARTVVAVIRAAPSFATVSA